MSTQEPIELQFFGLSSSREICEYLQQCYEHNWAVHVPVLAVGLHDAKGLSGRDCSTAKEKFNQKYDLINFIARLRPEFDPTVVELVARYMLPTMDKALTALLMKDVSLSAAHTQTVLSAQEIWARSFILS